MYFHTHTADSNVFILKLQWLDAAVLRFPVYSVPSVAAAFYSFSIHVMGKRKGVAAVLRICVKNAQGGTSAKFACKCFNLDSEKPAFANKQRL